MSNTRATSPRLAAILGVSLLIATGMVAVGFAVAPQPIGAATAAGSGAVAHATDCADRLSAAERSLVQTTERLRHAAGADQAGRCAAYRAHVAVLVGAGETYSMCMSGFARQDTVAQMQLAADNWRATIADSCAR
ncbi:hypothetical protein EDC22_101521 [Tepidamorphus gemmatus]|uniref:Uncharacterized protein n=1 Tax=Tepidamorphus gemmatus TaxID=747076 RepID=A0A4R3MIF5_9HYPH|nr:hypothetical protein [Tepidamorphus gemmatus]TCT13651.1 hypothetical protein EDC22_101521 [Tepidamorphus gemmatus]